MPRKGTVLSEAAAQHQREATAAWHKEHTEVLKFAIRVRKDNADAYRQLAARRGVSLTSLIRDYLNAECQKDGIEV